MIECRMLTGSIIQRWQYDPLRSRTQKNTRSFLRTGYLVTSRSAAAQAAHH